MKEIADRKDLLTRFLLDEVDERERAGVEDRLLSDTEFYEQMLAADGDLTDAYVRGELPASERERFEKSFLTSSRRRERVEFARNLVEMATRLHAADSVKPHSARVFTGASRSMRFLASVLAPRPAFRYAFAAAAIFVMAVAVWFAVERMRAPVAPQHARTEGIAPQKPGDQGKESAQNAGVVASNQQEGTLPSQGSVNATPGVARAPERESEPPKPRARPVFATITLASGSLRDGAATGHLFVPRAATHLRMRLELEEDSYQSYRATVSTPEGRRVWAGAARKDRATDARSVTLTLPVAALKRGDYVIELNGTNAGGRYEPAAQYSFRLTRED